MQKKSTRQLSLQRRSLQAFVVAFYLFECTSAWVVPPNILSPRNRLAAPHRRKALQGCSVELIDPETGCQVVLVGCFHGSQSSARDVQDTLLSPKQPSEKSLTTTKHVIVLELCASRFADLRRDFVATNQTATPKKSWLSAFGHMVSKMAEKRGLSTAAAAAVLGGVSGMQSALSGLQAGLEFTTALRIATECGHDIILADQAVDETLNKLGQLPRTSWNMWNDLLCTRNWERTFGKEASALRTALFGTKSMQQKVTLPSFLTRNEAAVQDLLRLALPLLGLFLVLNLLSVQMDAMTADVASFLFPQVKASSNEMLLAANAAFALFGYLSIALPATRIILTERDDQLTSGIRAACQLAGPNGRVVAVLGFLHVNGVAQRLLERAVDNGREIE